MELKNVKTVGRYKNLSTSKEYNIRRGKSELGHVYFYQYNGTRIMITTESFYNDHEPI